MHIPSITLALLTAVSTAQAAWPYGKFQYTVPFVKGGGSASIAELQGPAIPGAKLVFNPANSGADAWSKMKNDPKDGSVVTLINLPHIYIQPHVADLNANYTADDMEIAYMHTYTPLVLLVPATSSIKSWDDFVIACKTSEVTVSGAGTGTVFELGSTRLSQLARIPFRYESPGTGANTAINAMLAGNYTAAWTTTPVVFNRPDLRVLAIASEFEFPQIVAPTFKTLGINYVDGIYRGIGLPKGTPANIMKDVSDAFNALNRNLSFIANVQQSGAVQIFMEYNSPSLKKFTSTYRKSVEQTMFPTDPISRGSIYAMLFLAALGLFLTLVSAAFAAIYRNTPVIKGSSYFFNNIILLGITMVYLSMIVSSLQQPLSGVTGRTLTMGCTAMPWLLGLGFDITFSAIIVKSYRLYRLFLFSASSVIQFDASNLAILKWVGAICGTNAVVYAAWTIHDPLTATMTSLDGEESFYYACQSNHTSVYLGIVLALKYVMLIVCMFFTIKLRELNAVLNESKAIAAATFSTTFILTICLGVYALVNNFQGRFIIATGGIFIGTTMCLAALFAPKIAIVVFSPDSNTFEHVKRLMKGSEFRSSDEKSGRSGGNVLSGTLGSLGSMGSMGAIGSMGSMGAISSPTSPKARRASMDPNGVPVGTPIYVQEGKQIAREHRDRISAYTRVILNTAANGRISEFHGHIAHLTAFANRIKIMNNNKARAQSLPDNSLAVKSKPIPEDEDV
ncbi:7 transmembrane sweet-taste receptor of 3 GCPR-domain-containing protein [Powellomyces hirtus]|nr:7 transmembrane sweet-taste receptor of 3 GCPR-domain-containing protein [Powellomyces hirtus]